MSSVPTPSSYIVEAVARSKEMDPTALPPLYETIDPDALDAIFSSDTHGDEASGDAVCIQFTYAGRHVVVRSWEDIEVREPESDRDHTLTK